MTEEPSRSPLRVRDATGKAVRIKKRYLVLLVIGILAVAGAVLFVPFYVTTTPGFCYNCHIMEPFVNSWERSTHSKFGCENCHVEPGLVNRVVNSIVVSQNVYLNWVGRAEMPEQIGSANNQNCLQESCHTTNRVASTSGDLLIPHREHVEMRDLECKDCHFNVVHTADGGTPKPPMGVCAMCHDGERAPNECTVCHRQPPTAESEHPGLALDEHAEIAKGRWEDCFKCHHADQGECATSGCHDAAEFEKLTEEERMRDRFAE